MIMNCEQAKQLLEGLGSTSAEVAESLKLQGITGKRRECFSCPIAMFLIKNGADIRRGAVGIESIMPSERYEEFDTPPAISRFIRNFDDGQYPELES
jgi:hypothetical protein